MTTCLEVGRRHNGLFKFRKRKGLTQSYVSSVLGIRDNTYSVKERGLYEFTLTESIKLSRELDITVEEVYELLMSY